MDYTNVVVSTADKKAVEDLVKAEFRKLKLSLVSAVLYAGPCSSLERAVNAAFEIELLIKREL